MSTESGSQHAQEESSTGSPVGEPVEAADQPPGDDAALERTDLPGPAAQDGAGDALAALQATLAHQAEELGGLRAQTERFHDRSRAQEDVIDRMQSRIEELQADQVRALLGPVATELATLHGELSELAGRDSLELTPERVAKELGLLMHRVESSLELLGMEAVGAAPGVTFDRRWHSATRRIPTADPARDQTIATVMRQGFGVEGAPRATVMARVTVYQYDPELPGEDLRGPVERGHVEGSPAAPTPLDEAPVGSQADVPDAPQPRPPVVPMPPVPPGYHES